MNLYVLGTCKFQRVQQINRVTGDVIPGSQRGYGFFSRETDYGLQPDYHQCTWYPRQEYDTIFDGWMQTGRVFAFVSAILATICFVILFFTCCLAFSSSMFERWLFWTYIVAAITITFSFFIFGSAWCSENDCKVADGCGWAISAFMFHLLAANTVKSFAAPSPKPAPKRQNEDGEEIDDDDEELDDLYYEDEEEKYPPPHPDGPRGVTTDKHGVKEFDNGEDYYTDLGRLKTDDEKGDYEGAPKGEDHDVDDDNDLDDDDLDDISDHDLEEYASDDDDDDDEVKKHRQPKQQYNQFGEPIFDPEATDRNGNLGVGYENENSHNKKQQYDEFGNPIHQYVDEHGNPVDEHGNSVDEHTQHYVDEHGNAVDEHGNAVDAHKQHYVDEHGNPVDEFGNPIPYDDQQHFDEFVNPHPYAHPQHGDDSHPVDVFGNPIHREEYDEYGHTPVTDPNVQYDEFGNPVHYQPEPLCDENGHSPQPPPQQPQNAPQYDDYGNLLPQQHHQQQYNNTHRTGLDPPDDDPYYSHSPNQAQQQHRGHYDADDNDHGPVFT